MIDAVVRETHAGLVLLVGDLAYKVKKPVRTAYLDFTTPALRSAALRRELRLNRRLAPWPYLGIAHLSPPSLDDRDVEDRAGDPYRAAGEPVLVMRRMPEDRRLSELLRTGAPAEDALRAVARLLVAFHARADRSVEIDADGGRDALAARWEANLADITAQRGTVLAPGLVDAVATGARRFLSGRGPLLADRVARGRIVDGHGDLLADDVFCLDRGPQLLDCLDFDDRLRHVDVLDDAAFLVMDLERHDRPDLAAAFLDAYVEFSGDPAPPALRHHYVAYRAGVRAKVACLRHAQGEPAAAVDAVAHAELALRHLRAGEVRLVLVGGLPGTGKTTVATALADRFGAVVLSSDRLRKELAGLDPGSPAGAGYAEGIYSPARTEALHAELLHRAEVLLGRGESVVLDASWTSATLRQRAGDLARRTSSREVELRCEADAALARRRILERTGGPSDATPAIAAAMAAAADPWPTATTIPTGGTVAAAVDRAAAAWRDGTGA
ncbi:AAA family ATPase [Pseudonocardia lacus]|uniref:bifunctional aminoglycoside phosphotransferase/ATP-binding protein n=1 Tax=Pseudonocardia lacus TaxID=2835865 RepID=UPI001BDCFDE6|nr:AAA family ATPase [Pseudonocardia lacus]